jgi:hypothetical protein
MYIKFYNELDRETGHSLLKKSQSDRIDFWFFKI